VEDIAPASHHDRTKSASEMGRRPGVIAIVELGGVVVSIGRRPGRKLVDLSRPARKPDHSSFLAGMHRVEREVHDKRE
jgi:hypothetical protein